MAAPRTPGRMIRRSIAVSRGVARLDPEAVAVFCMILPHLDAYGKMLGDPAVVKETALPLARWATVKVIANALRQIDRHTNLKWWRDPDGRRYLHAIRFRDHQELREDRLGRDHLPSFPGVSPGVSPGKVPELVRPEVEVEGKGEGEGEVRTTSRPCESGTLGAARSPSARSQGRDSEKWIGGDGGGNCNGAGKMRPTDDANKVKDPELRALAERMIARVRAT